MLVLLRSLFFLKNAFFIILHSYFSRSLRDAKNPDFFTKNRKNQIFLFKSLANHLSELLI